MIKTEVLSVKYYKEQIRGTSIKPKSKYRNKKVVIGDLTFDSMKEYRRWLVLCDMLTKGEIRNLELQKAFEIEINGMKVCKYISDFAYETPIIERDLIVGWQEKIEDVKGMKTAIYRLKNKLMKAVHGIEIIEV